MRKLRFLRSFPQTSTRKFRRPQLLHKRELFFSCGFEHSVTQWVQRIRGQSQNLPTDDCGDAGGRLAILEGELPAGIRTTRVSAYRLPGHRGLLPGPLLERAGAVG
jgi:hypothetical protein